MQESSNNTGDFAGLLRALTVHKEYLMHETQSVAVWHCKIPDNVVKREVNINGILIYMALIPVKNVEKIVVSASPV